MIVVRIHGGLGNQLFQYGAGLAASMKKGCELILDTSDYDSNSVRSFELNAFSIPALKHNDEAIRKFKRKQQGFIGNFFWRIEYRTRWKFVSESGLSAHNPHLFSTRRNLYLWGYWQSYKYFDDLKGNLKEHITLKNPAHNHHSDLLYQVISCESVAVHVRRGDYSATEANMNRYGLLTRTYYEKAMSIIARDFPDCVFFVFSDDPEWAARNLCSSNNIVIVSGRDTDSAIPDFQLMRMCKHFIIANSTFSWWAAYLGASDRSKIIAPEPWFSESTVDTRDVLPIHWQKLPRV